MRVILLPLSESIKLKKMKKNIGLEIKGVYNDNPILNYCFTSRLTIFLFKYHASLRSISAVPISFITFFLLSYLYKWHTLSNVALAVGISLILLLLSMIIFQVEKKIYNQCIEQASKRLGYNIFNDTQTNFAEELLKLQEKRIYEICLSKQILSDTEFDKNFFKDVYKSLIDLESNKLNALKTGIYPIRLPFNFVIYILLQLKIFIYGKHYNEQKIKNLYPKKEKDA